MSTPIIEGIMDGTIDVIASGHSPTNMTEKEREFVLRRMAFLRWKRRFL